LNLESVGVLTIITTVIGVAISALLLFLVRRNRLHVSHGASWTAAIILFAGLGFAPGVVDEVAAIIEVGYPPIIGVMLAIIALVIKLLLTDINQTHLKVRQDRMAQKIALLESELHAISQKKAGQD
jgi:hypothetical protein